MIFKSIITVLLLSAWGSVIANDTIKVNKLDTLSVLNFRCDCKTDDGTLIIVGGNWTHFYPARNCSDSSTIKEFCNTYKKVRQYRKTRTPFWIKLYNEKGNLIFEGFKFSDCEIGPFICYYPNGNKRIEGQYSELGIDKNGHYIIGKCMNAKKVGKWIFYNENGEVKKVKNYR